MRVQPMIWAATLSAAALLTAVVPGNAMAASASGPKCNSSFNPYDYSQAQVSACGYKTFALSNVTSLAGGGSRYNYSVNGTEVHYLVPPQGFRPNKASAAQLKEFGFPSRPAGT